MTGVPPEFQGLPQAVLDQIDAACFGDWRRVTVDGPGTFMIHNQPQMRVRHLPPAPRTRSRMRAATLRAVGRDRDELPSLEPMDVARRAVQQFADGLPEGVKLDISDGVNNMPPLIVRLGVDALRQPDEVEVDPRTPEKGYAIVRFRRGDTITVLSLRDIAKPYVMAVLSVS